ncbi:antitoxin ParD1/3/4 [uncultured Thiomicrorhabdus sp.]
MNISLTPELENRIKAKVATGLYNNASEVIREALRFVELHQDWVDALKLAQLKKDINLGLQQLDAEEGVRLDSTEAIEALFSDLQGKHS